jgi:acyl carrier protein
MGLDSVELLWQFEKEFKKDVPDLEAEKIFTVENMASWFYQNLTIYESDRQLQEEIFTSIKKALVAVGLTNNVSYDQKLREIIPRENLEYTWRELARNLQLEIPGLNKQDYSDNEIKDIKYLGITLYKTKPAYLESNFRRFVECVGALNYKRFVDFDRITSLFEINIAVIGITYEKCGVEIDEIFLESSFTNDLGID